MEPQQDGCSEHLPAQRQVSTMRTRPECGFSLKQQDPGPSAFSLVTATWLSNSAEQIYGIQSQTFPFLSRDFGI